MATEVNEVRKIPTSKKELDDPEYLAPPDEELEAEPPELETLMAWMDEGGCEAPDGCWVEPDGTCPHGKQSWLLILNLI